VPSGEPLVTVSIVTHNGLRWLRGLFDSLSAQQRVRLEVLIFDNASTDGSVERLRDEARRDARVKVTESADNLGYAAAHNRNLERATGDVVVLSNQDVEFDGHCLERIADAFAGRPELGSVQARVRQLGQQGERQARLDTTGLVMGRDRRVVSRAQGEVDGPQCAEPGLLWGVDGPLAAYRRTALLGARLPRRGGGWEVLDEDFFMYKEDVDLAWRLRRLGWQAWYAPAALAWHARSASGPSGSDWRSIVRRHRATPAWIRSLSWRNQRLMQIKNEETGKFVRDLPWIAWRELRDTGYMAIFDPARLAAVPGFLRRIPSALRKRRYLCRRVLDSRR
jgi:GT2 family glycosyltransferase